MIVDRLIFSWNFQDDERVFFEVSQNPMHVLCERYYSIGKIPPLNERVKYLKKAGYDTEKIIKNHIKAKKESEKNQKRLDEIFAKFNIKPTKKKVLKPVKKN